MLGWNVVIMFRISLYFKCILVPVDVNSGFANLKMMSQKNTCLQLQKQVGEALGILKQDIDSDIEVEQNESNIDLDIEKANNTSDTNKTVPETFISKLNEVDSDKYCKDIDDDSCFDGKNDDNTTIEIMYEI